MKAEEILIRETDSFQASSRLRDDIIEAMQEYARIQIEKYRERVKLNARVKKISYPIGDHVIVDPESIDNTPHKLRLT